MEKWNVVGFKTMQFNDEKTGKPVTGYRVFIERPADPEMRSDNNLTGCITDFVKCWDGTKSEYFPIIGDTICVRYNRYGKIDSIETC